MQYIDFKVQHQTITRTDNYEVVGNSENYLYARFEFCTEWDDIIPTAVFSANNGKHISVLIENGECLVPWEMLRVPEFWVGVFGGDRQTTDTARVGVKPGVKFNARPGVEPTPTAYELLMNELRDGITQVEEHAESVAGNAEEAAVSAEDAAASAAVAESSAATADSAKEAVLTALNNVPTGSTVIVNDLTTGGTAAALSAEMGRVLAQRPNPNLLHNGYFANPVNQRGETSVPGYSATAPYFIDRWKRVGYSSGVLTLENGLIIDGSATANGQNRLSQILETVLPSGKYTLSILIESLEGTAVIQFCDSSFNTLQTTTIQETGLTSVTLESDAIRGVNFGVNTRSVARFKAIKLELGDTQTLAHQDSAGNWVLNEIPDYSEELVKCQRYQMVYKFINTGMYFLAHADSTTNAYVSVFTPSVMRSVTPTITADTSQLVLRSSTNTSNEISGISHYTTSGNMTVLRITSSDLTPGENYQLRANGASELIIDRNL